MNQINAKLNDGYNVRPNFGLILKIRPNACRHLKNLCKLGLRLKFCLRTKSDLFYQVTQCIISEKTATLREVGLPLFCGRFVLLYNTVHGNLIRYVFRPTVTACKEIRIQGLNLFKHNNAPLACTMLQYIVYFR